MVNFIGIFAIIPMAYLSNKVGKKKLGQTGNVLELLGLFILYSVSFVEEYRIFLLFFGVFIYAIGSSLFKSTWFALLDPLILKEQRVSFFATFRTSWKLFSLLFGFLIQLLLVQHGDPFLPTLVLTVTVLSGIQIIFYHLIPEKENLHKDANEVSKTFITAIKEVFIKKEFFALLKLKLFFPFMTGSMALIFNLYEKNILEFKADQIILMGNMMFIGALLGLWIGAWMIKKWGEVLVIKLISYFILALILTFSLSHFIPMYKVLYIASITCFLGVSISVVGMAETTIMLEYLPKTQKALGSAIWLGVTQLGFACSGLISAYFLGAGSITDSNMIDIGFFNKYTILLSCFALPLPWLVTYLLNSLKRIQ